MKVDDAREGLDIQSLYPEELKTKLQAMGEKPFRAAQLFAWLHQKQAETYREMTNLPEGLRERLSKEEPLTVLEPVDMRESRIDGTRKYLFRLPDGLPVLRLHPGRTYPVLKSFRDAGTGVQDSEAHRGTGI